MPTKPRQVSPRTLILSLISVLCFAAVSEAELRLEAVVEPTVVSPGEPATLHVRVIDEGGQPVATSRVVRVDIEGSDGIVPDAIEVAAGQSQKDVAFSVNNAGTWRLLLSAEGYRSAERWIIAAQPLSQPVPPERSARRASVSSLHPASPPPLLDVTVPPSLSEQELSRVMESLGDVRFEEHEERWNLSPEGSTARDRLLEATHDPQLRGGDLNIRILGAGVGNEPTAYSIEGLPWLDSTLTARTGGDVSPSTWQTVEVGEVRLLAQPASPRIPSQGKWDDVKLLAVWNRREGDRLVPAVRASELALTIELRDFVREPELDPSTSLTIPRGAAITTAVLSSEGPQTVQLGARWGSRSSDPLEVRFLRAPAHALLFHDLPSKVLGIGPLRRGVSLGIVDDTGAAAISDHDLKVVVNSVSNAAERRREVTIPAGDEVIVVDLDLPEPGQYTLSARTQRALLVPAQGKIEYRFAYWLGILALVGGLVGAAVVAVLRRERRWWRIVVLGVSAAVVAVLLALFGVLGFLDGVLLGASALQEKVPVRTSFGILLIALLAGMAGEPIIGFLSRPKAPAG